MKVTLSGDCRPFKVKMNHEAHGHDTNDGESFLKFNRECRLTCCCLNRPFMEVFHTENGQDRYIGKVYDPCNFYNMQIETYDANENLQYTITGSCCQLGVWCRLPCEPCQTIDFHITDNNGNETGFLQKVFSLFLMNLEISRMP